MNTVEQDHYFTIAGASIAEYKDRGSRFIAHAYPLTTTGECKKYLQQLKKEHPKAVHHCFAYRIGLDGNSFRTSDDGEPSGTAGHPILNQIDSKRLTDTIVIVTRYFGGTLLGVPGLINAYRSATAMALQTIAVVKKKIEIVYDLHFDYTKTNEVMLLARQLNCTIISQEMQLFCEWRIGIPKARLEEALYRLGTLPTVKISAVP